MKTKFILGLAFVLGGGLFGCSSIDRHSANSKASSPDLYLHLFASFIYPEPPRLILSAPVPLSTDFDLPMLDGQHLKGRIDPRNGTFSVHFQGLLCSGMNVFDGEVDLEHRYEPAPQPYDIKAPFLCQPHFVLSANSSPKPFLKRQAAAENKDWNFRNPFTPRQLAEINKQFHLMRPGMTKDEVFALLGLSGYENRLVPRVPVHNSASGEYQLADGERLCLFFDITSPAISNTPIRHVVRAELDTLARIGDAPPVWRVILEWP